MRNLGRHDERLVGTQSSKMGPLHIHSISIRPLNRPKQSCIFQEINKERSGNSCSNTVSIHKFLQDSQRQKLAGPPEPTWPPAGIKEVLVEDDWDFKNTSSQVSIWQTQKLCISFSGTLCASPSRWTPINFPVRYWTEKYEMDISIFLAQVKETLLPTSHPLASHSLPKSLPQASWLYTYPPPPRHNLRLILTPPEPIRLMFFPQPIHP